MTLVVRKNTYYTPTNKVMRYASGGGITWMNITLDEEKLEEVKIAGGLNDAQRWNKNRGDTSKSGILKNTGRMEW